MASTQAQQEGAMPIAIVGMSGRFPGQATTPDKLWDMIAKRQSARAEIPKSRYNIDAFHHASPTHQGSSSVRHGHFMDGDDVAAFDAPFFKITAQEAHAMDPQQRLSLELAYEALEAAGLTMESISGSDMGCYMACCVRDYAAIRAIDPDDYPRYEANGSMGTAMIANRISWFFDLKGASISLDTACSSSLVALHLACQAIRTGESSSALVGATNLILMPHTTNHLSTLSFLSPDAKSQAFDANANGYARGEGVSVMVVKALDQAVRDGDVIRAVIRGTSITQDGRTPGINLPSAKAQEHLIQSAYKNAGLDTNETRYFEAHGPGTPAGDPLETSAIGAVFGKHRTKENPLYIGSVKTNIGHLEATAGLAGLVKAVYALEKGRIPPNIYFEKVNPKIKLDEWGLSVPTKLLPWPTDGLRRASINSFGYGGTNAHCVIDDAYHYLQTHGLPGRHNTVPTLPSLQNTNSPLHQSIATELDTPLLEESSSSSATGRSTPDLFSPAGNRSRAASSVSSSGGAAATTHDQSSSPEKTAATIPASSSQEKEVQQPQLLLWSSHEQSGITRTANNLHTYLSEKSSPTILHNLSHTLSSHRSKLPWTSFIVARDPEQAMSMLPSASSSSPLHNKPLRAQENPTGLFVFTGQGAQWNAMGRELLHSHHAIYSARMKEAAAYLSSLQGEGDEKWDLLTELSKSPQDSRVNEPQISQPACTAVQVALVDLLAEWGLRPAAVVGHSSGEIGAAYAKGAVSREAAWKIAYHRGRLSAGLSCKGSMLAVAMGEEEARTYTENVEAEPKPVVACVNSPQSVTVSGSEEAVDQVVAAIGDKAWCRKLLVKTPYHSPFMRELADAYLDSLAGLEPGAGGREDVKMFSSVTGEEIQDDGLARPQYWVDNMVCPVKFSHALSASLGSDHLKGKTVTLLEVGPHGALQGPVKQILAAQPNERQKLHVMSLLMRKQDAVETSLTAAGLLYQKGFPVNLTKVNHPDELAELPTRLVDLPPFAWNHNSNYWYETAKSAAYRNRELPKHDLLGSQDEFSHNGEPCWRNFLRLSEVPWLRHYVLSAQGQTQGPILSFSSILSAVVEAVRQRSDPLKTIEGIQFRDVFPGAPLVLSEAEDSPVETKLQLRPWRLASRSLTTYWMEFTFASRAHDGTWTQHSTGLVSLKYATEGTMPGFTDEEEAVNDGYRKEYEEISKKQLDECHVAGFYERLSQMGIECGSTYQPLLEASSDGSYLCGVLEVSDSKSVMPAQAESRHVIHPTTLEGVFQLLLSSKGVKKASTPKYIESIYISTSSPTAPGTKLQAYGHIKERRFDGTNGRVVLSDSTWSKPLVIFDGLKCTEFDPEPKDSSAAEDGKLQLRKLGAYSKWDIDIENSPNPSKALGSACSAVPLPDYDLIHTLEWAAYIICKRTIARYPEASKNRPHHLILHNWMMHQLSRASTSSLPCQSPEWLSASRETEDAIMARASATSIEGRMMNRIFDHIPTMLFPAPTETGEIALEEPWEVMNHDNLLNEMYRSGLSDERTPAVQCEYLRRLSHKRPLRILEVGAGTGSATSKILAALSDNGDPKQARGRVQRYTYTDVSGVFFEPARDEFEAYSDLMEYKVLDVEKDPGEQGFDLGSYDVVIAFQVLHATSFIGETLANCKKLLRPGGHLLVTEVVTKIARRSVVFGVLAGWWLGEKDGRPFGPEMSEEEWDSRLRAQGFSGVDWCFRDRDDVGHSSSIMASTVPGDWSYEAPSKVVIVTHPQEKPDNALLTNSLKLKLEAQGMNVGKVSLGLIEAMDLKNTRCITTLDLDDPVLCRIQPQEFAAIKHMLLQSGGTVWLTKGASSMNCQNPEGDMINGLARTLRGEHPEMGLTVLDLDVSAQFDETTTDAIMNVFRLQDDPSNTDNEFALRRGEFHVPRICPDEALSKLLKPGEEEEEKPTIQRLKQPGRQLKLELNKTGDLDGFYFRDDAGYTAAPLGEHEVEIEVKAIGLDTYDMAIAVGQIWDPAVATECSGIVTQIGNAVEKFQPGDRVMGFGIDWYRTNFRNTEDMFHRIPNSLSFEEGASLMVSHGTAAYSIFNAARLEAGETILIHSAASHQGQAAIGIAQHLRAEVLVTVSSEAEKQLLQNKYNISGDHIFSNRDAGFVQGVKRVTNGEGVQVVLNCLTGELLRQTWHCIAPFGRFIELGMKDIKSNTGLDMVPFANNASFSGVNILTMYRTSRKLFSKLMANVVRYYQKGVIKLVKPLPEMKLSEIGEAFRLLQSSKFGGKVVLSATDDDVGPIIASKAPEVKLRSDATYIVPGGTGGLGRNLISWMAQRGARNIALTSRSGDKDPKVKQVLKHLSEEGVRVKSFACDISDESECQRVLNELPQEGFPPVKGAVILSMNVKDSMFETMSYDNFPPAIRPKYNVSINLHRLLPKDLDFFICMSSAAGQIGSIAQSNYNTGNVYQNALIHHRRALGLKGTSINLGWMGDIGFVASEHGKVPEVVRAGAPQIFEPQLLAIVGAAMRDSTSIKSTHTSVGPQPILGLASGGLVKANGDDDPYWFGDARFGPLATYDTQTGLNTGSSGAASGKNTGTDLAKLLGEAKTAAEAREHVCEALMRKLAKGLMMELEDLDQGRALATYGVDSLVAVDLRAWALKDVQSVVHVSEILRNAPMVELAGLIASKSKLMPAALRAAEASA